MKRRNVIMGFHSGVKKQIIAICLMLSLFGALMGCQKNDISINPENGKEQIVLAMLYEGDTNPGRAEQVLQKQIEKYNMTHSDYEIVIKEYRQEEDIYDGNVTLLQREVVSGEGPDIINFGWQYNTAAVAGKYTVDLRQYIDNDPEIKENLFPNILDALSVEGGLYALPSTICLNTLVGCKTEIGDISRWDVETMLGIFEKSGKEYPLGHLNKLDVFNRIFCALTDEYVDWEKGTNSFDSDEFRSILEYADKFDLNYGDESWNGFGVKDYVVNGYTVADVFDTARIECEFQTEDVNYIGFPCHDGCGTIVEPGDNVMAITMSSNHKQQAWEFIKQLLSDDYQLEMSDNSYLPITKSAITKLIEDAKVIEYYGDEKTVKAVYQPDETYESFPIYSITDKQAQDLLNLIESVDKSYSMNCKVDYVIYEEADAFFEGQQSIDQAIDNIVSRVWLYISEKAPST